MHDNDSKHKLIFDLEKNSQELKITIDIYRRILTSAIEQTQNDITDIESVLADAEFEKIGEISHRIKGDYGNMRIEQLSSLARKMERVSKEEKDKEQLQMLIDEFKNSFSQLTTILQAENNK